MNGTLARRIRHLEANLATAHAVIATRDDTIRELHDTLRLERLARVSAQRGLVAYLERYPCLHCGRTPVEAGIEVGYNPDTDPAVRQEIAEGKIPPLTDPEVIRETARAVVASKRLRSA